MSENIEKEVLRIVAEQALLEPSDISTDQSLEELGIDSLGLVEAIFAIEETFDITVPFNANEPTASAFDISTVKSIVSGIKILIDKDKS